MAERRRKRPGRPPLADDEKKSRVVQFRATEAEWEELTAAALASGMTLREWLLMITLRAARRSAR